MIRRRMEPHGHRPWYLWIRPWGGIPSEPTATSPRRLQPPGRGGRGASRGIAPRARFLTVPSCLALVLVGCGTVTPRYTVPATRASGNTPGVLVLAHGGSRRWNHAVQQAVAQARLPLPSRVAFGMGMHPGEVRAMQRAVEALQRQGVSRLIVVPLLVSSASDVMRQYEFLFGLREHGSREEHAKPLTLRVPVAMTRALDDDPVVAELLLERALQVSRLPQEESVVLIAHGPTTDEDNARWLAVMERLASQIRQAGRFREVVSVTMRDDAPAPVQEEATRQMRLLVERQSRQGRTLVVPLLLANGGIEMKIPKRLTGLSYIYQGRALLPHPKLAEWIARQVAQVAGSMSVGAAPVAKAASL